MEKFYEVLVVDDDPIHNTVFKKLAEWNSFSEKVVSFISAVDCLDYLKVCQEEELPPPTMIFLDIKMPIVNGWEFLERLEKMNDHHYFSQIAIYMLTSSSEQSDINKAKKYNMVTDYFVKPITMEILNEIRSRHQQEKETQGKPLYS
jgi:CheY-like chemotaxis protein